MGFDEVELEDDGAVFDWMGVGEGSSASFIAEFKSFNVCVGFLVALRELRVEPPSATSGERFEKLYSTSAFDLWEDTDAIAAFIPRINFLASSIISNGVSTAAADLVYPEFNHGIRLQR